MEIAATLRSYDGKRVAPFRAVAEAVREGPVAAMPELLKLAESDEAALQVGATWVIKHLAERGDPPSGRWAGRTIELIERVDAPDATLHLLQTLPYIEIPADREKPLRHTLEALTRSRRAFVRAWAYNGLGLLAGCNAAIRPEIEALFDVAERTETAAVRARIRHARVGWGRQRGPAGGQPDTEEAISFHPAGSSGFPDRVGGTLQGIGEPYGPQSFPVQHQ